MHVNVGLRLFDDEIKVIKPTHKTHISSEEEEKPTAPETNVKATASNE